MKLKVILLSAMIASVAAFGRPQKINTAPDNPLNIDSVYLITPNDNFDISTGEIADFKVKADFNTSWTRNKERIEEQARKKGANIVLIKFIGWNKHNHCFYASGTLYYADSARVQKLCATIAENDKDDCSIVILRDNGPSLSTYYFDVTINGEAFPHFSDMTFIKKHLDTCNAVVHVTIKRHAHEIPFQGHTRYFRMLTDAGSPYVANGLSINIGGPVLQEIENAQLGSLLSRRLKKFKHEE